MASKVTPSIPGAPSFLLAISYAARRVSILQTWTYSPQNRQDGSAFALTYILRLRSCKSMDAFVISSLPSPMLETLQMAAGRSDHQTDRGWRRPRMTHATQGLR